MLWLFLHVRLTFPSTCFLNDLLYVACDEATPIVVRSPSLLTVLPGLYLVLARSRMETDLLRTYELERMVVNLYPSQIRPQSRRRLC